MEVNGYRVESGADVQGADLASSNLSELLQFEVQIKETSN